MFYFFFKEICSCFVAFFSYLSDDTNKAFGGFLVLFSSFPYISVCGVSFYISLPKHRVIKNNTLYIGSVGLSTGVFYLRRIREQG